ncbi:Crp/Fnr family transcriptional regulator [bacterium SCSIO 12643]|nr:Crp/Fnr family transcriptional regulator [bacterium SCSIO 12643]
MSKELFNHFNKYVKINEPDFEQMLLFFDQIELKKKELLMRSGQRCYKNHFVLKGCLHLFFVNDKGIERTVQFAIENWWLTDFLAFHHGSTTEFSIQAVEPTQVLSISYQNQEILLQKFPQLEKYFRHIYQISYGAALIKMKHLYNFSKEEMYFNFIEQFPEFEQRVPQYLIASFLGLTPEYVSEIRSKNRS